MRILKLCTLDPFNAKPWLEAARRRACEAQPRIRETQCFRGGRLGRTLYLDFPWRCNSARQECLHRRCIFLKTQSRYHLPPPPMHHDNSEHQHQPYPCIRLPKVLRSICRRYGGIAMSKTPFGSQALCIYRHAPQNRLGQVKPIARLHTLSAVRVLSAS